MAHPDDVAFVGVECAISVICYAEGIELPAEFKAEWFGMVIIVDHYEAS